MTVGYLGGIDERKGYRRLIEHLRDAADCVLLLGGQYTREYRAAELGDRAVGLGLVSDLDAFYAACDVVAVPSLFDPCPMVVLEAVARGIPVIATNGVGTLPHLVEYGAGVAWDGASPLGPVVRRLVERRDEFSAGASAMAADVSERAYGERLSRVYEQVLSEKRRGAGAASPVVAAGR
jgi:glycosyltransferase involved in cell wall biosynthesis